MALVSLQNVSLSFGGAPLLENLNLQIEKNQNICLLGRNGAGKTSLMRTIAGEQAPDSGVVQVSQGVRISHFAQKIPDNLSGSVFSIIAAGLGASGELLVRYHELEKSYNSGDQTETALLERLRHQIEDANAWNCLDEIGRVTSRLGIESDWQYENLSGGQKRRVILAAALVSRPDVLLLDEPTNHLDINTIAWLEEFLQRLGITILFVTHDRMLLRRLASRIIELDRGHLYDWSCDYDTFLRRKEELLAAEAKDWERFDKKLAQEEVWIRKGIKARRTRNEGRVRSLKKLREERRQRRQHVGKVSMQISVAQNSGKDVIEARNLVFSYPPNDIIRDFSLKISRGDKIGIIGANGCGKTTLVKLLLGQLKPHAGEVEYGTNLEILYYDQMREQLDESKTVWENVLPTGDVVEVDGRSVHIITYLQNFLFTPDRAKTKVSVLSGGERNRVLLARLFSRPANLLVLDEPTNDLDVETLELLEELLIDFPGTVLLICHDRTFLNNVASSTIVFAENGEVREIVGGYDEWLNERKLQEDDARRKAEAVKAERLAKSAAEPGTKPIKMSFKEKQELQQLPGLIEQKELEISQIEQKLSDPEFYRTGTGAADLASRLKQLEEELMTDLQRWEDLQNRNDQQ
ncbi:MAG: ABC transporter ATP-binding protein [Candidatus Riflebacteria bacterium HGW-Riflebacteria-1]|jgi:ATP-binding cassette subfamily F protein uup|nr:MAG: ABC transporter ATP-binding protein [Candidatus Riflebacteria bacterium HGW-Riflebacteria-1]